MEMKILRFQRLSMTLRKVENNDVFVCITGFKTDGHNYAKSAVEKGATAIICEKEIQDIPSDITIIKTENTRKALAIISDNYYNHPSQNMNIIGVTGTNGKTTTTFLIKSILDLINHKVGVIGTIENRIGR